MNIDTIRKSSSMMGIDNEKYSSSSPKVLLFRKETRTNSTKMHGASTQDTSTPAIPPSNMSFVEEEQVSDEFFIKEQLYNSLVKTKTREMILALRNYSLEYETVSQSEELMCDLADKYSIRFLGEILMSIYVCCYGEQKVLSGLCAGLERFDSKEVYPWGQSIVIGLINHRSSNVKERVISLIDNWGDRSLLPALKNIEISSTWMREYVDSAIAYLEDK